MEAQNGHEGKQSAWEAVSLALYPGVQWYSGEHSLQGFEMLRLIGVCGAGESEESHRELVNFCREFKFERMGCFAYSEEEGTPAAEMGEQVQLSSCSP